MESQKQNLDESNSLNVRCWVFGSSKPLAAGNPGPGRPVGPVLFQWLSHGQAVSGRWRIVEERFLVVLREPEGAEVSGCSIDSMVGEVKQLEKELETRLLDSSRIFYRTAEGPVDSVNRLEFKALAAEGRITPETEVFDTTLTNLSDLKPGVFSKPLKESWHLRLYEQAVERKSA